MSSRLPSSLLAIAALFFAVFSRSAWAVRLGEYGRGIPVGLADDVDDTDIRASNVIGVVGSNVCPPNYEQITSAEECSEAAAALGMTYKDSDEFEFAPKGCLVSVGKDNVYYNTDPIGAENPKRAPICKGGQCSNGIAAGTVCCAKSCGACGGSGCSSRPGGAGKCCGGHITRQCTGSGDTACRISDAQAHDRLNLEAMDRRFEARQAQRFGRESEEDVDWSLEDAESEEDLPGSARQALRFDRESEEDEDWSLEEDEVRFDGESDDDWSLEEDGVRFDLESEEDVDWSLEEPSVSVPFVRAVQKEEMALNEIQLNRIRQCAETSPWTGLKEVAALYDSFDLGDYIATQIRLRLLTQGEIIYQGAEGFCGPVAVANALILIKPDVYANVMADIFCLGETDQMRSDGKIHKASQNILECAKSVDGGILFRLMTMGETTKDKSRIHAVDWMWAAMLAEATDRKLLSVLGQSQCGGSMVQGQTPSSMAMMTHAIFPNSKVSTIGGILRHVGRVMQGSTLGLRVHHFALAEWAKIMEAMDKGSQVFLTVDADGGKSLRKITNHWVLLTQVIDETFAQEGYGLPDGTAKCAAAILRQTKACVVWTWGKYYVYESCDNLRKNAADAIEVTPPEDKGTKGPWAFLPGEKFNRELLEVLVMLWKERNQMRKPGMWPSSEITTLAEVKQDGWVVVGPGQVGTILNRHMADGRLLVYFKDPNSLPGGGNAAWLYADDPFHVTKVGLRWQRRGISIGPTADEFREPQLMGGQLQKRAQTADDQRQRPRQRVRQQPGQTTATQQQLNRVKFVGKLSLGKKQANKDLDENYPECMELSRDPLELEMLLSHMF